MAFRAPGRCRRIGLLVVGAVAVSATTVCVAVVAGGAQPAVQQAGAAVAYWAGVRYQGIVTDSGGRDTDLEMTVAADGSAYGVLQRPFGASAEIGFTEAGPVIRGNQEWWLSSGFPEEAPALADRWIADPPASATGLGAVDLLTPASLSRALTPPGDEPWTTAGDHDVGGGPGQAWSDNSRHVVVSTDGPPRILSVDVPLAESPYALTLPLDIRSGAPADQNEHDNGLWEAQIDASVAPPTDDELEQLEDVLGEIEELAGSLDEVVQQVVQDTEAPSDRPTGEECRPRDPGRAPDGEDAGATGAPDPPRSPTLPDPSLPWLPPSSPPPPPPGPDGVIGGRPSESGGELPPVDRTGPDGVIRGRPPVPVAGSPPLDPTGGVDFSSLELRYVRDSDGDDGIEYAFSGRPGGDRRPHGGAAAEDLQASDAFFVWLALPPSSFWVNLNPAEPDRITDPRLARTDVGRILLEADLEMKKVSARLLHPDTPLGQRFWDSVEHYRDGVCSFTRYWIVPGPATVSEKDGGLYILDAPLQVHAESMVPPETGAEVPGQCHSVPPSIVEHNETLERALVRPEIERAVNESPQFAALRQVYLSRVAAEWYRNRSQTEPTPLDRIVDSEDVSPWVSRVAWSPREVFDRYVESLRTYELDVVREERHGDTVWEKRYTVGGVDWTRLEFHEVDPTEIEVRRPGLTTAVAASFQQPTTDPEGVVWRGSAREFPPQWRESRWRAWSYLVIPILAGIAAVGLPAWLRRRRSSSIEPGEIAT